MWISVVVRFVREDAGQDMVEYALLAGFVALVAGAALNALAAAIGGTYASWDTNIQNIWEPPNP